MKTLPTIQVDYSKKEIIETILAIPLTPQNESFLKALYQWIEKALLTIEVNRFKDEIIKTILTTPPTPQNQALLNVLYQAIKIVQTMKDVVYSTRMIKQKIADYSPKVKGPCCIIQ